MHKGVLYDGGRYTFSTTRRIKKTFPTNPGEASFIPQGPLTSVNPPHFIYKDLKCEKHSLLWSFDTFEQLDFSYHLKTRR